VCALETVLAERSEFQQRRRASHLPRSRRRAAWGMPREQVRPASSSEAHRILVVADDTQVRLAVARDLAPRFDILHALSFTSAVRKLEAGEPFSALVIDLGLSDTHGASWFLARLVDHAFEGPRILLSRAIGREHASSLSQSCVSHFALPLPWAEGELRARIERALGVSATQASVRGV
jgi:DNA-binding NtrC family response regulator